MNLEPLMRPDASKRCAVTGRGMASTKTVMREELWVFMASPCSRFITNAALVACVSPADENLSPMAYRFSVIYSGE